MPVSNSTGLLLNSNQNLPNNLSSISPNLNSNLNTAQPNFDRSVVPRNNSVVPQPASPTPLVAQNMQYLFPDQSVPPPFVNTAQNSAPALNRVNYNLQTPNYQQIATPAPQLQPRPLNNPFAFDTLRAPDSQNFMNPTLNQSYPTTGTQFSQTPGSNNGPPQNDVPNQANQSQNPQQPNPGGPPGGPPGGGGDDPYRRGGGDGRRPHDHHRKQDRRDRNSSDSSIAEVSPVDGKREDELEHERYRNRVHQLPYGQEQKRFQLVAGLPIKIVPFKRGGSLLIEAWVYNVESFFQLNNVPRKF